MVKLLFGFFGKRPRVRDICALQMSTFDAPDVAF
jgi:hypothetical protein